MLERTAGPTRYASKRDPLFGGQTVVNAGNPLFSLTPSEKLQVFDDIGRHDVAAEHFVADIESCLQAFEFASGDGLVGGLPATTAAHLAAIVDAAATLRSALYGLPGDVAMLIDLHLLSEGARRRLTDDLALVVEPLEDIAGAIVEIQHGATEYAGDANATLENRLVRALAVVYRNRLNRKATADQDSGFPTTLAHVLQSAGHRLPRLAAASAAITPARLRAILGATATPGVPMSIGAQ